MIDMQTAVRAAVFVSMAAGFLSLRPALADDASAEKPKIQIAFVGVAHIHTPEFISTLNAAIGGDGQVRLGS